MFEHGGEVVDPLQADAGAGPPGERVRGKDLQRLACLRGVHADTLCALAREGEILRLGKAAPLNDETVSRDAVFFVLDGAVSIESPVAQRDAVLADIVVAGGVLWDSGCQGRAAIVLRAEVPTRVVRVDGTVVRALIGLDAGLAIGLLDALSRRSRKLVENVMVTRSRSATARIACYLNEQVRDDPGSQPVVTLLVSKSSIARLLDLTASAFSRAFRKLIDDGLLVGQGRRKVRILDRHRLELLAAR